MTNKYNTVVYTGVTNDIRRRTREHKKKLIPGFTSKYNCVKLVWYEQFDSVNTAIAREKQIKNWKREWKNELIEKTNPYWYDLAGKWFSF